MKSQNPELITKLKDQFQGKQNEDDDAAPQKAQNMLDCCSQDSCYIELQNVGLRRMDDAHDCVEQNAPALPIS